MFEDYDNLPLLQENDVHLMQAFVENGYQSCDLKCLNFICKYVQAISLANIAIVDGHWIPPTPMATITDYPTTFIHSNIEEGSHQVLYQVLIQHQIKTPLGLYLGDQNDHQVNSKWLGWASLSKNNFTNAIKVNSWFTHKALGTGICVNRQKTAKRLNAGGWTDHSTRATYSIRVILKNK